MIILDAIAAILIMKFLAVEQSLVFLGLMCMITFLRMSSKVSFWLDAFEKGLDRLCDKKEEEVK